MYLIPDPMHKQVLFLKRQMNIRLLHKSVLSAPFVMSISSKCLKTHNF